MENITTNFKLCPDYRRERLDFSEIQWSKDNPIDLRGRPTYPITIPSSHGSSYTYKISKDWFFKRKLQDGNSPQSVFSQHHQVQAYNELSGSLDDLGEVLCYILAKNIKNSTSGEPIVSVSEYKLASYLDEKGITQRGCISRNVCTDPKMKLVNMSEILKSASLPQTSNSIDVYMSALKHFCNLKNYDADFDKIRETLIKNSYFCWKVANSDNHKLNITFLVTPNENGKGGVLNVSPLIDNGSAYELSTPYFSAGTTESKQSDLLIDDENSKMDENGNRVFSFTHYPFMHSAFNLDPRVLLFDNVDLENKNYEYEYCLACEMLSDKNLYEDIYQIDNQISIDSAINEINEIYGTSFRDNPKSINWPPLLKEFMHETNNCKSRILSLVVADYYFHAAYTTCVEPVSRVKPTKQYEELRNLMIGLPLQQNKEAYDKLFTELLNSYNISFNPQLLETLEFKNQDTFSKPGQQPV